MAGGDGRGEGAGGAGRASRPGGAAIAGSAAGRPPGAAAGTRRASSVAAHRPAQIRHRPARLEQHRRRLVHVVQQEHALVEAREQRVEPLRGRSRGPPPRRRLRARRAHAPCRARSAAGRGTTCRRSTAPCSRGPPGSASASTQPRPKARACFSSVSSGTFDGGFGDRRQEAEELVHVEQRAQRRTCRAARAPTPAAVEQQRDEEHPLAVAEVRDRHDGDARLAVGGVEQRPMSSGSPSSQAAKPGAASSVVEPHGEREAIGGGEERLELEHADLRCIGRRLHLADERRQIQRLRRRARPPAAASRRGRARGCVVGSRVDAGQREQAGRRHRLHARGKQLGLVEPRPRGGALNVSRIDSGSPARLPGV